MLATLDLGHQLVHGAGHERWLERADLVQAASYPPNVGLLVVRLTIADLRRDVPNSM